MRPAENMDTERYLDPTDRVVRFAVRNDMTLGKFLQILKDMGRKDAYSGDAAPYIGEFGVILFYLDGITKPLPFYRMVYDFSCKVDICYAVTGMQRKVTQTWNPPKATWSKAECTTRYYLKVGSIQLGNKMAG